jgi:uncharacterized damage-inducible protein DinB
MSMTLLDAWRFHCWTIAQFVKTCDDLEPQEFTKDLGNSFLSIRDTLVHCYMADSAWAHRIKVPTLTQTIT